MRFALFSAVFSACLIASSSLAADADQPAGDRPVLSTTQVEPNRPSPDTTAPSPGLKGLPEPPRPDADPTAPTPGTTTPTPRSTDRPAGDATVNEPASPGITGGTGGTSDGRSAPATRPATMPATMPRAADDSGMLIEKGHGDGSVLLVKRLQDLRKVDDFEARQQMRGVRPFDPRFLEGLQEQADDDFRFEPVVAPVPALPGLLDDHIPANDPNIEIEADDAMLDGSSRAVLAGLAEEDPATVAPPRLFSDEIIDAAGANRDRLPIDEELAKQRKPAAEFFRPTEGDGLVDRPNETIPGELVGPETPKAQPPPDDELFDEELFLGPTDFVGPDGRFELDPAERKEEEAKKNLEETKIPGAAIGPVAAGDHILLVTLDPQKEAEHLFFNNIRGDKRFRMFPDLAKETINPRLDKADDLPGVQDGDIRGFEEDLRPVDPRLFNQEKLDEGDFMPPLK